MKPSTFYYTWIGIYLFGIACDYRSGTTINWWRVASIVCISVALTTYIKRKESKTN